MMWKFPTKPWASKGVFHIRGKGLYKLSDGNYRLISTLNPTLAGYAYHDIHLYPIVSSVFVINQLAWPKRETILVDDSDK